MCREICAFLSASLVKFRVTLCRRGYRKGFVVYFVEEARYRSIRLRLRLRKQRRICPIATGKIGLYRERLLCSQ